MSRAKGCPRVPHKWPEFRGSFKALSYAETLSATISPTNCYIRHFKSRNCDVPQRRIYAHELTATPPQLVSAKRDVHSFRDAHKQVLSGVIRLADRFIDRRFLFFLRDRCLFNCFVSGSEFFPRSLFRGRQIKCLLGEFIRWLLTFRKENNR